MTKKKSATKTGASEGAATASHKPVTPNFVSRRIGDVTHVLGIELEEAEKVALRDTVVRLANSDEAKKHLSPAGTPTIERITPETLAKHLIAAHFVEETIDLSAKNIDAAEFLAEANKLAEGEIRTEVTLHRRAQQSRDPSKVPGIREISTDGIPGFSTSRGWTFD